MPKMVGFGTSLQMTTGPTTATTFSSIASIRNIDGPAVETSEVDATTLDSTGAYREFLPGLLDPGALTMELAWDPNQDTHQLLHLAINNRTTHQFKMILPTTGFVVHFKGQVRSIGPAIPLDDVITASVGVRVSGPVTWPTTTT